MYYLIYRNNLLLKFAKTLKNAPIPYKSYCPLREVFSLLSK